MVKVCEKNVSIYDYVIQKRPRYHMTPHCHWTNASPALAYVGLAVVTYIMLSDMIMWVISASAYDIRMIPSKFDH